MKKISKIIVISSLVVLPQTAFAQETENTSSDLQLLRHCETLARGEQSENKSSANLIDELGLCFTYIKEISALRKEFSEIGSFDFNQAGLNESESTAEAAGSGEQPQSRKFLNADEVKDLIQQNIDSLHNELLLEQSLNESSLDGLDLDTEAEVDSAASTPASEIDFEAAYVGQIRQDNMDKHIVVVTGQYLTLAEGDRVADQVFEKRRDGFYLGDDKLMQYVPVEEEDDDAVEKLLDG